MEQYYYMSIYNSPAGPFTLDQLRSLPLLYETLVWKTALPNWVTAGSLPELVDKFSQQYTGYQAPSFGQQGYGHQQYNQQQYGYNDTYGSRIDYYSDEFNTDFLSQEQVSFYSQHGFYTTFHPVLMVFLHLVTLGLFTIIYHGLKHDKLPKIQHDDFSSGKAIGFLFIPYFNLYWIFVFWKRIVARINFQYKLRHLPEPISKQFTAVFCVFMVIPYINIIAVFILMPILSVKIQMAANQLAEMQQRQF